MRPAALGRTPALLEQGKYGEAADALEEALRIAIPALGEEHLQVARYRLNLARVNLKRQNPQAAETLLRQTLEVRRRAFSENDWQVAMTRSLLGEALTALGRYDEAERLLLQARGVLKDVPGPQGREAKATTARLAALYAASGRTPAAR